MHDTGYFSALPSLEEYWQQVTALLTSSADAHFDSSAARPRPPRTVEVARNARLFSAKLNLLASAEACKHARASGGGFHAAPRGLRKEQIFDDLEELAQTRFLLSFFVISLFMRGARDRQKWAGRVGLPSHGAGARVCVCAWLSFSAHFAPRW